MNPAKNDEGAALIAVMAIGLLIVSTGVWLADALVTEYRDVEDSFMEVRAYWASMGQGAYVLSRTAQSGACQGKICPAPTNNQNPGDYQTAAQNYLNEITSGPVTLQTWPYPDVNSAYQFTIQQKVCVDPLAPSASLGEMLLVSAVGGKADCPPAPPSNGTPTPTSCPAPATPPAGSLPALRAVNAVRPVEIRYCLVASGASTCGTGPGATTSGAQLVTSVHRPRC